MTGLLLLIFSSLLAISGVVFAVLGACEWAAGREFESLELPGDISQALHAEVERRYRASLAAGGGYELRRT